MTAITQQTRLVQISRLPAGMIDGELMALDTERGEVIGLDAIGTVIWSLLVRPLSAEELLDQLVDRYEVDREQARLDVMPFLEEMLAAGLIGPAE